MHTPPPHQSEATATPSAAITLLRITSRYDTTQDRISLTGQGEGQRAPHVLWFTQRLLLRLLPMLWQWLEHHDIAATQDDAAAHPQALPHANLWQEAPGHAATEQLQETAPVEAHTFSPQWLVSSAQLRTHAQALELLLSNVQDAGDTPAMNHSSVRLVLEAPALRQWLTILLQLHEQAEWPTSYWPQWLTHPADINRAPIPKALLH